ncbi:hypothetical protein ACP70R_005595 [Stipagrostis hirtigluma subsp. patula]
MHWTSSNMHTQPIARSQKCLTDALVQQTHVKCLATMGAGEALRGRQFHTNSPCLAS